MRCLPICPFPTRITFGLLCDPLTLTRVICVTMGLELSKLGGVQLGGVKAKTPSFLESISWTDFSSEPFVSGSCLSPFWGRAGVVSCWEFVIAVIMYCPEDVSLQPVFWGLYSFQLIFRDALSFGGWEYKYLSLRAITQPPLFSAPF